VAAVSLHGVDQSRVVVVDDNLPSLQLVQALLDRAGLRSVQPVTDARELLARYEELAPDLVLLDLHMPGVDGYTVLAELRRRATAADLPVLVLTADTTREATHRALQLGANDFLTKPLDAAELILRVRNLLLTRALHVGLQRRHRWLEASGQLARDLLSGSAAEPLRRVSELAREAAAADLAVVAVPTGRSDADQPMVAARVWVGDESITTAEAISRAFSSGAVDADTPQVLDDLDRESGSADHTPTMLVPLIGTDRLLGALLLCRASGRPPFNQTELALAGGFATQAAMAVEFAQARADQERMLVLADRHRIARDLHDQVIQRLFATGLRLQQLASRMEPGPVAERIDEHVSDLDDTITEIRSTIFGLRQQMAIGVGMLTSRLRELVAELTEVLGFEPRLRIDDPLDEVSDDVADDLVSAAREAITNVARHAQARHVEVTITLTDSDITLEVVDDGIGIGNALRRSGLTNLYERALRHGGSCAATAAPGGGTHVTWTASLGGAASPSDTTQYEQVRPDSLVLSREASVLDGGDGDGAVSEELVRAGIVTSESGGRHSLDLDGDVERTVRTP
jgi:signal transduction histidine kinase